MWAMGALIHVTAWERKSLWRRLICAFTRVAALLMVFTIGIALLGPPIAIFLRTRWEAKNFPAVTITARPLEDYSVSEAPGTSLTFFGYSFEVPWTGPFKTKGVKGLNHRKSGVMGIMFDSGRDLIFIAPANQNGFFNEIVQDPSLHMANWKGAFGDLANRSAYDQYSALLNISPSAIRPFGPIADAARGQTLLTIKAISLPGSLATGAFSFEFSDKRGFQIGDPRKSRNVSLEVFTSDGHWVEIICTTNKRAQGLSQPELNRILKTVHSLPSA